MASFVLIHSPLVGPLTWELVAAELRRRGHTAVVPSLTDSTASPEPLWRQHAALADEAVAGLPEAAPLNIVGHSGAGWLLPAIGAALGRPVAAYLFVDAQLPLAPGASPEPLPPELQQLLNAGGRYPNWRDDDLREEIPDPALRARLLRELQPRGRDYFETPVPLPAGWPDAPRGLPPLQPPLRAAVRARPHPRLADPRAARRPLPAAGRSGRGK